MRQREFNYWANMPDEDKQGKFMCFQNLTVSETDLFVDNMTLVESADCIMVPLDQIDMVRLSWLASVIFKAVTVIDVPYMYLNSDVMVSNVQDLER